MKEKLTPNKLDDRICTGCENLQFEYIATVRGISVKKEKCTIGNDCYEEGQCNDYDSEHFEIVNVSE